MVSADVCIGAGKRGRGAIGICTRDFDQAGLFVVTDGCAIAWITECSQVVIAIFGDLSAIGNLQVPSVYTLNLQC